MAVIGLVVYALCDLVAFLLEKALPDAPWAPYVPLLVSYHLFLIFLLIALGMRGEQKIGISLGIPMTVISHLAFVGGLIGIVFGREYVPLFGLVRYVLPGLAPFEARWLFEGKRKERVIDQRPLPQGSAEDYDEFLQYMRQKDRRFQKPGRSIHDEFEAWNADRAKRRDTQETKRETV